MRKTILAGNWKMNKTLTEAQEFFLSLNDKIGSEKKESIIMICPSFIYLQEASILSQKTLLHIGAQDVSKYPSGAYTGDISANMLSSCDINYCIVGHSERREYYKESNEIVNIKILQLRGKEIIPILCIGESLEQRENDETFDVLSAQLEESLKSIEITVDEKIIIAYEPIWAIGTGKTATPEMAQEVHQFIRNWLKENYDQQVSEMTSILYGGSVKPENIQELMKQDDIDGALVGGASLDVDSFYKMFEILP
jgi:triosephosphate isomerase